jgi:hypothetical protein
VFAAIGFLLMTSLTAGSVYADTENAYHPWYRLFDACQMKDLEGLSKRGAAQPNATFISGDWESKLVLAALTPNASRAWFMPEFFLNPSKRAEVVALAQPQHPLYVVVDEYARSETPGANLGFLHDAPWESLPAACRDANGQPTLSFYAIYGAPA